MVKVDKEVEEKEVPQAVSSVRQDAREMKLVALQCWRLKSLI